jgi:putative CocE/NonD family hydrolase
MTSLNINHLNFKIINLKIFLFFLATAYSVESFAQDSTWVRNHYYKIERYIPARDGVKLFTAIYIPKDTTELHPILMTRTPYSCAPYGENNWPPWWSSYKAEYFKEGYIMVRQDGRGRFMSEGTAVELQPFKPNKKDSLDVDESTDTYDAIDWLVKNVPYNNGNVGVLGISYDGFFATEAAMSGHPALKAVSPQAPVTDVFIGDDVYHNGAFMLASSYGFLIESGFGKPRHHPTMEFPKPNMPVTADLYDNLLRMGAVANLTKLAQKDSVAFWMDITNHPYYDDWWKKRNTRAGLFNIKPAMLEVGGFFDAEDLYGSLHVYEAIQKQSPATSNKLVMGPWFHGQWSRRDGEHLGNIKFGMNTSQWYQQNIELIFFNYYLKGRGKDSLAKATIFFTGENKWQKFDQWPPANSKMVNLYFTDGSKLGFSESNDNEGYDEYVSDPAKPVPYVEGIHSEIPREFMINDQRFTSTRPDVLVYKTDELAEDITLAGPLTVDLRVSTTGTDADFIVKLIDVFPDNFQYPDAQQDEHGYIMNGYQMLVRGGVMRGKFRNSFEKPEAFVPGKITEIKYSLNDVAHRFKKGHRIMVQIQSSWFPLVDRNPQTFTDIFTCTEAAFQKATIKIYHGKNNPSFIKIPILK